MRFATASTALPSMSLVTALGVTEMNVKKCLLLAATVLFLSNWLGRAASGQHYATHQRASAVRVAASHNVDLGRSRLPFPSVVRGQNAEKKDAPPTNKAFRDTEARTPALEFLPSPVLDRTGVDEFIDGMTLESLEQMALANNPSIRQASAVAAKAMGVRLQVGLRPNPTIGYFGQEIGNDGAAGLHGAFVAKTFVRGDKLALNRQVIGHDVASIEHQVESQKLRVRNDVRILFYESLAAQKRLELARQFLDVADEGVKISKDLVKAKEAAVPDVLQSEMQLAEVTLAIQQAEFDVQRAWRQIAATAGVPDLPLTPLVGALDRPIYDREMETEYAQILSASPQLSAAWERVRRAQANIQRQRAQAIPNVRSQFGVGQDTGTGDPFANIQMGLILPIRNANQGSIRAARAAHCEAIQNVERIKLQIRRELAQIMREFQVAKATVEQYEMSLVPKAKQALELLLEAQKAGEFDFLRVFTTRRTFFDVNQKYVAALGDLAIADAKIDGMLLTGGLSNTVRYNATGRLRGQALGGQ